MPPKSKRVLLEQKREVAELRRWVEAGEPWAVFNLAVCYARGEGVRRNRRKANELYHLAAKGGCLPAMHNLGVVFSEGLGVRPDRYLAYVWFLNAARKLHEDSVLAVLEMIEDGLVPHAPDEALHLLRRWPLPATARP